VAGEVREVAPQELAALPQGLPVCAVRALGTDRLYMLIDGRKVPLDLPLPIAPVGGLDLDGVPSGPPALSVMPAPRPTVTGGRPLPELSARPRGVYACVVDVDPRFHLDAVRWYASLTRIAGVDPADLIVHAVEGADSAALTWLEAQGVSIRPVELFDPRARYCNKISGALSLAAAGVEGMAVLTDADVAICEDLRSLRVAPAALAIKLVDAENPPLPVLKAVFAAAGIDLPPLVPLEYFPERSTAATNANGGLYVVRGSLLPQLAGAWEYWARWLLDRSEQLGVVKHADQVAMALAVAEAGFEPLVLSPRWNLPVHARAWITEDVPAPVVLHYHDKVEPSGLLSPFGLPGIDACIETVNEAIVEILRLAGPAEALATPSQLTTR
jgi:hypothetical protein